MSALFCLPKREQSSVLNALEVRCLVDPVEIARWNDLVCKHHYLENANLVGEQFGPIGCLRLPVHPEVVGEWGRSLDIAER